MLWRKRPLLGKEKPHPKNSCQAKKAKIISDSDIMLLLSDMDYSRFGPLLRQGGTDTSFFIKAISVPEMVHEVQKSAGNSYFKTILYSPGDGTCESVAKALSVLHLDL